MRTIVSLAPKDQNPTFITLQSQSHPMLERFCKRTMSAWKTLKSIYWIRTTNDFWYELNKFSDKDFLCIHGLPIFRRCKKFEKTAQQSKLPRHGVKTWIPCFEHKQKKHIYMCDPCVCVDIYVYMAYMWYMYKYVSFTNVYICICRVCTWTYSTCVRIYMFHVWYTYIHVIPIMYTCVWYILPYDT